jgi:cytochrome c oxidase cbb3-type subunit I/II
MFEPTQTSDNSIMPRYPWLYTDQIDVSSTVAKIKAMQRLGVPYGDGYEKIAASDMELQANEITKNLMSDEKVKQFVASEGIEKLNDREIIALIAYLQRLGKDIKVEMKTNAVAKK